MLTEQFWTNLGDELAAMGGFLRCEQCGHVRSLDDPAAHTRDGWPRHCGYTMRWWTQRQVNAGEVPEVASR